jgi:hypothetical protein
MEPSQERKSVGHPGAQDLSKMTLEACYHLDTLRIAEARTFREHVEEL